MVVVRGRGESVKDVELLVLRHAESEPGGAGPSYRVQVVEVKVEALVKTDARRHQGVSRSRQE